jgi:drug/metabolite transporter (DMT)-like permease
VARGRFYALASACCFATLGVFSKKAYEHGAGDFELLCARVIGAMLLLGALGLVLRAALPRGRMLAIVFVLGGLQLGTSTGLLVGFSRAPAALVVLLFYAYPVLVSVGAAVFYDEPFGRRQAGILALGLVGVGLTAGRPGSVPLVGVLLGLLAAVCTTGYFLGGRYMMSRGVDPVGITTLLYLSPSVLLLVVVLVRGFEVPNLSASAYGSGVVMVGTVIPILMLFAAIRLIGAGMTALLSTIEPFLAIVFAYAFLDERLTGTQLVGGACILAAVVVSALPSPSVAAAPA